VKPSYVLENSRNCTRCHCYERRNFTKTWRTASYNTTSVSSFFVEVFISTAKMCLFSSSSSPFLQNCRIFFLRRPQFDEN